MTKTSFLGDKLINRIGFGAMQLAGRRVFGPPRDPAGARAVLRRAIELGVDHIDTAQYYGPDVVNDLIRESLHPYPENLKLVTKVGGRRDDQGGPRLRYRSASRPALGDLWSELVAPYAFPSGGRVLGELRSVVADLVPVGLVGDLEMKARLKVEFAH